ncbi:DUF1329 domain-containing protein [Azoarcus sp. KH32C]|uniref:DUF1329 domain-containing protein n=1 Tax=Azoarcus sp. KH32C TaxID=748247 RepID=UPI000238683A|nr:DUF1329 domain-containing protein [Azoarcus sp. KH32C]BAL24255.1 hypothetical protein AZKH_1942 [Azoarcus sp. KH32C]
MKFHKSMVPVALALAMSGHALAAVTAQEAQQLGTTLTPTGAEKAGNKEGTIPEWKGGLTAANAGVKPDGNRRPDPFADEKPRLSITGKDVAAHADKLTEGTKELLKRYPTMRVDVYPTHRTVNFPQRIVDNTRKNAVAAKTTDGGVGIENVLPGFPFPIPKTGNEVMWNHLLTYRGLGFNFKYDSWNVGANGTPVLATTGNVTYAWPVFDPKKADFLNEKDPFWLVKLQYLAPARRNGEALLVWDSVSPLKQARRAWQYLPGQRRVKLAPEVAYDTPNPGSAGASTYDDATVFNGAMDRFDFNLVGKKEMYVPSSNYKLTYYSQPGDITKPGHVNPDLVRWELHRVWVVEAKLKEDKRHIYSKRVFYIDEDSWAAVASDQYDARGQLYRSSYSYPSFAYDVQAQYIDSQVFYDFNVGMYNISGLAGAYNGIKYLTELPGENYWAPDALAGAGVR